MALSKREVDELIRLKYALIYKYMFSMVRNKEKASDLTQDTFLLLIKKAAELENDNLEAWLYVTAHHLVTEYFRKENHTKGYVSVETLNVEPYFEEDFSEIREFNEENLSKVQRRLLALLSEEEQKAFIALFIRKKDITVFAQEENISVAAANMRKSRLKKKVKILYRDTYFLLLVLYVKFL